MFGRRNTAGRAPDYLIVGLGNPGREYERTRHNAGFLFIDALAKAMGLAVSRLKFQSLNGDGELAGHRCLLLKPQTFMNNSGQAIRDAAAFYKIPPEHILVVYDDISLEPGVMRIRRKGSDGGHNGVNSIPSRERPISPYQAGGRQKTASRLRLGCLGALHSARWRTQAA